jgi:hypothetical protein
MGSAIMLYLVEGIGKVKFLKKMGWTESDGGYNSYQKKTDSSYIGGITTWEEVKENVTNYIDEFI